LLTQPKNWAQSVGQVDFRLSKENGRWKLREKYSKVIRVTDEVVADPEILAMTKEYEEITQKYLDTPIARVDKEISARVARYEDNPLIDLILKVEMEYGKADVALASVFNPSARIPAGPVTIRQISSLYFYENSLYTAEITGKAFKQALEHAAEYFRGWPLAPGASPVSGKLAGYNCDMAEGVSYKIDLRRPPGRRIVDLQFRGKPLSPNQKLRLAVNSYRYAGGGQYTMLRNAPILLQSSVEIRELMIEYVKRSGTLSTEASGNWEILPPEARSALLQANTAEYGH
jgi:2',3'-cyclic-nucleotide 2'-phosphodiesterase/3'-nucleotidase